MSGFSRSLLVISAMLVLGAYQSFAGLVMQRERYEEGGSQKSKATIYMQDNKVKSFDEDGQFSVIFKLDDGEIIQVDNISRTYSSTQAEVYFSYYKEYALKLKAAMQQQLSELPPDQRAQAELRMKQQGIEVPGISAGPLQFTFKKTGEVNKIAGYKSEKYEIYRDGRVDEEIWTSNDERLQEEIDMKKMGDYLSRLREVEDSLGGARPLSGESNQAYLEVYSSGFPMKTLDFPLSGKSIVEKTVKVSKKKIDDSEFNAPSGYKKVLLQQMLQLGAQ
jgi:hypothetical protein